MSEYVEDTEAPLVIFSVVASQGTPLHRRIELDRLMQEMMTSGASRLRSIAQTPSGASRLRSIPQP